MLIGHVDTLVAVVNVEDYDNVAEPLLEKLWAMQQEAKLGDEPIHSLGGRDAIVLPHGSMGFTYGLKVGPDFNVFLAGKRSSQKEFWPVKVELSQWFLWSRGGDDLWSAWYDVMAYLYNLGLNPCASKVSRIDLCADTDEFTFEPGDTERFVTRARKRTIRHEGHTFVGWDFALGNELSARVYLKSLEVLKHGKSWFTPIWMNHGWEIGKPVWRVEFQARRDFIRSLSENGVSIGNMEVDKFLLHLSALWRYCTGWLSLRKPEGDNRARWPAEERWSQIASTAFESIDTTLARNEKRRAREEQLDNLLMGVLSSKAALQHAEGFEEIAEKVGKELVQRAPYIEHWFKERVRVKRVRFGE